MQLRRQVLGEARPALNLFALWWFALGALTFVGTLMSGLAQAGVVDINLWEVYTYIALAGLCVGLWALLYYLLYLFTGSRGWLPVLSIFYIFYYMLLLYWVQVSDPQTVVAEEWGARVEYANEVRGPLFAAILSLTILPQIIGSIAYFTLVFRVKERAQRYRIAMVSLAIIGWFGLSLLGNALSIAETDGWQIVSRLLGLGAATMVVMAYQPPARVRRWLTPEADAKGDEAKKGGRYAPVRKTRPIVDWAQDLFRVRPVGALF